jgi:ribosomal protein S12 methylthiotransferase accessory factor
MDLQPWESLERWHRYVAAPDLLLRKKSDVLKEMMAPCGRFGSVAKSQTNLNARISELLGRFDSFADDSYMITRGVPLNWQILLDYLHENGITSSTEYVERFAETDLPHRVGIKLLPGDLSSKTTDGKAVKAEGFGRGVTPEETMSKAVGELLERYFLAVYRDADLSTYSIQETLRSRKNFLDVSELNGYLPWQQKRFPRFVRDETKPIRWVEGINVMSGRKTLLPAQFVFWSYDRTRIPQEPVLGEANTNGSAGHFTYNEALLAAILEVVQRDGLLIYWLNSLTPRIIDTFTISDPECVALIQEMRRYDVEFYFLNTTTELGIPSSLCVTISGAGEDRAIGMGGSCGFSERELIFQSASEALVTLSGAMQKKFDLEKPYQPFVDHRIGRDERLLAWRGEDMLEKLKFFISGKQQSIKEVLGDAGAAQGSEEQLKFVLARLHAKGKGYECYAYEAKNPILKKLNYHAVHVIIPKLVNLHLFEPSATLDAPRLREVPALLGYKAAKELNPWPHPFP